MQQTELQLVGELGAVLRLAPGEGVARQVVGVPDVVDASDAGTEHLLVERDAAHRHAAEVHAVVAALAADEPEAPASPRARW